MANNPLDLLQELAPDLDSCNKCGFCMSVCPTYKASGMEWLVTRGRVSLVQDVLKGDLSLQEIAPAVESCLLCRACVEVCPPKVPIDYLMTRTRAAIRAEKPWPWLARTILRQVLPYPSRVRAFAKLGGLTQKLGLRKLAAKTGMLKPWPTLERANQVGPSLSGLTAREALRGVPLKPPAGQPVRARVAYFVTCTRESVSPLAARAAVRVLVAAGCEVLIPEAPCCGLALHSAGDLDGARALGRQHLSLWSGLAVDAIIVDEGSCAGHLMDLPHLFHGHPEEAAATELASRFRDLATFLVELGPPPFRPLPARVTWHDPCHLRHYLGVMEAPRQLIRSIPGVEFVEGSAAGGCCGGAGAIMLTQPELSDAVLADRVKGYKATRASYWVTSSPSCHMQLERGAAEEQLGVKVLTLAELLEGVLNE